MGLCNLSKYLTFGCSQDPCCKSYTNDMALIAEIWLLIIFTDTEFSTKNSRYINAADQDTFDKSTLANKQRAAKDLNNML